jgi:ABC-type Zn uptake system ZnuABC Zn-binding protein ZnuA
MSVVSGESMRKALLLPALLLALGACTGRTPAGSPALPSVVAAESFLADFAGIVAGGRVSVVSLIPTGMEPHSYEPTPRDIAAVAGARLVIVNGAGLESFLGKLLQSASGSAVVVEASAGLASRTAREGETAEGAASGAPAEPDPHFWLDPTRAISYVTTIRDALTRLDPAGAETYAKNAADYVAQLVALDAWIRDAVAAIPEADRLLVTNHESLGYYADRYGFRIVGTIIPSVSAEASPTARQVARLIDGLKAAHARAVFLETGSNPQLAQQVAKEAGIPVVTELFTHSLSDSSGPAANYLAMMRYDTEAIVKALTGAAP